MSDPTSPSQTSQMSSRRRRAMIACTNCRKRKIKCVTAEEPPRNPCARCSKRRLECVYVAVDEDYTLSTGSTPEAPDSQLPTGGYPPPTPGYSMSPSLTWNPTHYPHPAAPPSNQYIPPSYYNQQQPAPWLSRQQPSSKCIQAAVCARRRQPPEWTTELLQRGRLLSIPTIPYHGTTLV
ncbi:hypothetical protein B0H10DRAFT_46382 [Mycena sp. CBHHK59/15]|nr:hypothetical protein B0H10DRAFT_46382 [Mycena sp. CBHHK59/15]